MNKTYQIGSSQPREKAEDWKSTVDPSTGRTYWYHRKTRQTTWQRPIFDTDPEEFDLNKARLAQSSSQTPSNVSSSSSSSNKLNATSNSARPSSASAATSSSSSSSNLAKTTRPSTSSSSSHSTSENLKSSSQLASTQNIRPTTSTSSIRPTTATSSIRPPTSSTTHFNQPSSSSASSTSFSSLHSSFQYNLIKNGNFLPSNNNTENETFLTLFYNKLKLYPNEIYDIISPSLTSSKKNFLTDILLYLYSNINNLNNKIKQIILKILFYLSYYKQFIQFFYNENQWINLFNIFLNDYNNIKKSNSNLKLNDENEILYNFLYNKLLIFLIYSNLSIGKTFKIFPKNFINKISYYSIEMVQVYFPLLNNSSLNLPINLSDGFFSTSESSSSNSSSLSASTPIVSSTSPAFRSLQSKESEDFSTSIFSHDSTTLSYLLRLINDFKELFSTSSSSSSSSSIVLSSIFQWYNELIKRGHELASSFLFFFILLSTLKNKNSSLNSSISSSLTNRNAKDENDHDSFTTVILNNFFIIIANIVNNKIFKENFIQNNQNNINLIQIVKFYYYFIIKSSNYLLNKLLMNYYSLMSDVNSIPLLYGISPYFYSHEYNDNKDEDEDEENDEEYLDKKKEIEIENELIIQKQRENDENEDIYDQNNIINHYFITNFDEYDDENDQKKNLLKLNKEIKDHIKKNYYTLPQSYQLYSSASPSNSSQTILRDVHWLPKSGSSWELSSPILWLRCPGLRDDIEAYWQESQGGSLELMINASDVVIGSIIEYIHTGMIHLPSHLYYQLELLRVVMELKMVEMQEEVEELIEFSLSSININDIYEFAMTFDFKKLINSCQAFLNKKNNDKKEIFDNNYSLSINNQQLLELKKQFSLSISSSGALSSSATGSSTNKKLSSSSTVNLQQQNNNFQYNNQFNTKNFNNFSTTSAKKELDQYNYSQEDSFNQDVDDDHQYVEYNSDMSLNNSISSNNEKSKFSSTSNRATSTTIPFKNSQNLAQTARSTSSSSKINTQTRASTASLPSSSSTISNLNKTSSLSQTKRSTPVTSSSNNEEQLPPSSVRSSLVLLKNKALTKRKSSSNLNPPSSVPHTSSTSSSLSTTAKPSINLNKTSSKYNQNYYDDYVDEEVEDQEMQDDDDDYYYKNQSNNYSSSSNQFLESEYDNEELHDCPHCERRFRYEALQKHVKVCEKVFLKKRKVFDQSKVRLQHIKELNQIDPFTAKVLKKSSTSTRPSSATSATPSKSNWRDQSNAFREAMKAARNFNNQSSGSSSSSTLAAPSSPYIDPSFIQCPNCLRRFNQKAAERHLPICKNIQAKPTSLKKGTGLTASAAKFVYKR